MVASSVESRWVREFIVSRKRRFCCERSFSSSDSVGDIYPTCGVNRIARQGVASDGISIGEDVFGGEVGVVEVVGIGLEGDQLGGVVGTDLGGELVGLGALFALLGLVAAGHG
jgi:hypothetical protein